ncbi:maleylacetoacetate isomerase [Paraburkholderia sp. Cy-641]|uniref:maleylacetoacetate isomerase n=1 Tax=Paraburkholderia sp. Cy-641 TaxID=2608337 RepID=UPI0014202DED|nr:maleylacetoacetate isomerase [Paraburkholderia sp. Cy-641]NIF78456.1 maleylacetoacetate isomerase [Paraburkholderia sp. Cy-641]
MELHSFFNSSASYRVRIALNLKGLPYEYVPVNIRTGEHRDREYVERINPSAGVPALVDGDFSLGQSLAIIDWLDQIHPEPLLIPGEIDARARVLELATLIACDIHPVNNMRILKYLDSVLKVTPEQKNAWYRHWIVEGMQAVERLLTDTGGDDWCIGDAPTLADCCLIPQIANAERMGCDLTPYSRSMRIYQRAMQHPAFFTAAPKQQPDYTN